MHHSKLLQAQLSRIARSAHDSGMDIRFGSQVCGDLVAASAREWLVTDGLGGFAMGTVGGLRTRRYHGLLVVATEPPIGRQLGLAALDPVLVIDGQRHELATREWSSGHVAPQGLRHLTSFELIEGVPRWRWQIGDMVLEAEVAMLYGRPATGVVHRLVSSPRPVRLELAAVATWRDAHGERFASGDVPMQPADDGFVFDNAYRVRGPGYQPCADWWRGSHQREEAARGLQANEDLCHAGTFAVDLQPGRTCRGRGLGRRWHRASRRQRSSPRHASATASVARTAKASSSVDRLLAHAADQFIVAGPTVVAGYPWFGDWSRDTFTSYEGLFLCTGRHSEGAALLRRAASSVSEGMLANTADVGGRPEYNTADATMWFLHALARHIEVTGDLDLAIELMPTVASIIDSHVDGNPLRNSCRYSRRPRHSRNGRAGADVDGRPRRRHGDNTSSWKDRGDQRAVDQCAHSSRCHRSEDRTTRRRMASAAPTRPVERSSNDLSPTTEPCWMSSTVPPVTTERCARTNSSLQRWMTARSASLQSHPLSTLSRRCSPRSGCVHSNPPMSGTGPSIEATPQPATPPTTRAPSGPG